MLAAAAMLAVCLTGCGGAAVELNDYIEITCDGYDTMGKAEYTIDYDALIDDYAEEFGLDDDSDWDDYDKVEENLTKYIKGDFDTSEGISNGDTITFVWDANKDKIKEKYSVNLKFSDISYTVDELDEIQTFDPFDYITVSYSGYAPYGKLDISKSGGCPVSGISYTADKTEGLSNNDTVVITAEYGDDLAEYCARYGYLPEETEHEFTVSDLPSYAMSVSEIPAETQDKLKAQAEDGIAAMIAKLGDGCSVKSADCVGYYMLTRKNGFSSSDNNILYCVYKVEANMTGITTSDKNDETQTGVDTFYTYYKYTDIINLADGVCSVNYDKGSLCDKTVKSTFGYKSFWGADPYKFSGYEDLDTMFNDCVTKYIEKYDYENTVE